jgi:pyridoxine kinase
MARILTISSQVVFGPVGNTALVPALQNEGHEVLALPTIVLSHHPGHGPPQALRHGEDSFERILDSVEKIGNLHTLDAVLTGYFTNQQQVIKTAALINRLKQQNPNLMVLVDPVLGDNGRLYVGEDIATAIRDQLLPFATIITPNVFELSYLTKRPIANQADAQAAAQHLAIDEVVVTSIPVDIQHLGTLLCTPHHSELIQTVKRPHVPNGTGDYLSGGYLAQRLNHPANVAFHKTMENLERVINASTGSVLAPSA